MDLKFHEPFIKPISGLYDDYCVTVEGFKEHNAELIKGHWIDTRDGDDGGKIYELFDENIEGKLIKESLQEWMCDNRREIITCVSIALNNHEWSYAEWFKYVDDCSGPDGPVLFIEKVQSTHCSLQQKLCVDNHEQSSDVVRHRDI